MFMGPESPRTLQLRRSEIFRLVKSTLRSSGAKEFFPQHLYEHLAALRPGQELWPELYRHHASHLDKSDHAQAHK